MTKTGQFCTAQQQVLRTGLVKATTFVTT